MNRSLALLFVCAVTTVAVAKWNQLGPGDVAVIPNDAAWSASTLNRGNVDVDACSLRFGV